MQLDGCSDRAHLAHSVVHKRNATPLIISVISSPFILSSSCVWDIISIIKCVAHGCGASWPMRYDGDDDDADCTFKLDRLRVSLYSSCAIATWVLFILLFIIMIVMVRDARARPAIANWSTRQREILHISFSHTQHSIERDVLPHNVQRTKRQKKKKILYKNKSHSLWVAFFFSLSLSRFHKWINSREHSP